MHSFDVLSDFSMNECQDCCWQGSAWRYLSGGKTRRQFIMPGVSVSDFFLKYRDISNAWIFSHIRFHKKSEVEWYFNKLTEFDPPIIGPIR